MYKYTDQTNTVVTDGKGWSGFVTAPEVQAWLAAGNTPEPADPPPPPGIPQTVTMRQARLALLAAGKLAAVSTAIGKLPSAEREAAQIEWEYSTEVHRQRPFVLALAPALGLDDAALDALFVAAAAL
jgi:hypothetical protein